MRARHLLDRICEAQGFPPRRADGLLPLAEYAVNSPAPLRRSLIAVLRGTVAHRARRRREDQRVLERRREVSEADALLSLGRLLHGWNE